MSYCMTLCYFYLADNDSMTTTALSYNVIIIIVVATSVVGLIIFNCVVACICLYLKCKQSLAKTSDFSRQGVQLRPQQPTSPIYDTAAIVSTTLPAQDLEMTENVAYAPIQSKN